jgi:hypothetical protein
MVHCLRCGATHLYDPDHYVPHVCDAPARAIETPPPRGDDTAKRLATLEFEARSRLNALERRIRELEALPAAAAAKSVRRKPPAPQMTRPRPPQGEKRQAAIRPPRLSRDLLARLASAPCAAMSCLTL